MARRAAGLPRSAWGTAFAHLGLGITLLGIVGETQWGAERIVSLKPGEKVAIRNYDVTFDRTINRSGPNYSELAAIFTVRRHGEIIGIMEPSKRNFASRGTATTESALMARGVSQLYMSLGDINPDGSVADPALLQAAGAADLARLRGDVHRRRASRCPTAACGSARRSPPASRPP